MNRPKMPKKPSLALDTTIVQDNLPQQVVPGIWIGSIHAAFNQEALLENGITHILNASRVPATFPRHFTYLSIDIRDREDANILACIPASNIFLEAGIDAGGVLIHCFGGRSRSAAFVCAYLMSSRGWSLDRALEIVTAARPVAAINSGFDRQLRAYMETQYDVYASQQVLLRNRISSLQAVRADGKMVVDMGREHDDNDAEDAVRLVQTPATPPQKEKDTGSTVPVLEGSAPNCRLSRPGSTTVRVIPPLRGLERRYGCVGCGRALFSLANVVQEECEAMSPESAGAGAGASSSHIGTRPASSHPADELPQFKIPQSSPKVGNRPGSQGSQHLWQSKSSEDGDRPSSQGTPSAPVVIPAAPKSTRNAERRSFSFGDDIADSKISQSQSAADESLRGSVGSAGGSLGDSIDMDLSESPQDSKMMSPPVRSLVLPSKTMARPQSAEKRRWLARVSLLKADSKESIHCHPVVPDAKSAKLAADDQGMVDVVDKGKLPFFIIEYLGWMGTEPLGFKADEGKLECPGCGRPIGTWSWRPESVLGSGSGTSRREGDIVGVGPPLFKALRSSVQLADLPLDATPMSTPRPDTASSRPNSAREVREREDSMDTDRGTHK
eukprot:GSChrysophyteH1.ASY1.ANO1.2091.1 assembled CDS